jgi:UDP-N-acetylmuramyl pentapeptide phosphotransferase/UDP-N-acetylglucosamine-1-phosphate transferase
VGRPAQQVRLGRAGCSWFAFGWIGWWDDWIKIVKRDPNGMKSRTKYFLQSVFGLGVGLFLYYTADAPAATTFYIPFFKTVALPLVSISFVFLAYLWVVGFSNAVNLTDGLDGLRDHADRAGGLRAGRVRLCLGQCGVLQLPADPAGAGCG